MSRDKDQLKRDGNVAYRPSSHDGPRPSTAWQGQTRTQRCEKKQPIQGENKSIIAFIANNWLWIIILLLVAGACLATGVISWPF